MHIYGKMRAILSFLGILALTTGCQKIPEPAPEIPQPAEEKKVQDLILSLAGEVGERDPKTGHITIVILSGGEVNDKILGELVPLKKLEILELRDTAVTSRGISKLKKIFKERGQELEVIQTKGAFGGKPGAKKTQQKYPKKK